MKLKYKNGVDYHTTIDGMEVTFRLHGFCQKVVERFNEELAKARLESVKKSTPSGVLNS